MITHTPDNQTRKMQEIIIDLTASFKLLRRRSINNYRSHKANHRLRAVQLIVTRLSVSFLAKVLSVRTPPRAYEVFQAETREKEREKE